MATASENLFGREGQSQAFSRFGPQFQQQNDTLIRDIMSRLGNQSQQGFEPIEKQARQGFQRQTLPSIAERFTSLGNGAASSPVLNSNQTQAGIDLDTNLAALKSQYGFEQNNQLMQLLNLLSPEQAYFGRQPGLLEGGAQGLAEGLPQYLAAQGLGKQQEQGNVEGGEGFDWQDAIGNLLLSLAPAGAAFGPPGLAVGAGAAALGGGLKYFNKKKGNQGQNFNAQQSQLQQQLMKLGVSPQELQQLTNPSQGNTSPQYGNLNYNNRGSQNSPLGQLDFSAKSPGLNRIASLT
jgi:hypothetical protein